MNIFDIVKKNDLLFPDYSKPNIVDLMNVLYGKYEREYQKNKNTNFLEDLIPDNKHILFILIDGMGSNLINKLPNNSFLKKNKKLDLLTVFPSTTACVLTSVVTATFPLKHGIWGWFNYNRNLNKEYYPLLFKDRHTLENLENEKIKKEDIYKVSSILNNLQTKVSVLFPQNINDSIYSKFVINDSNRYAYNSFKDIKTYFKDIISNNNKSYTYLYISDIDTLEHKNGIDSPLVLNKLKEIENLLLELNEYKDLTIVVTADHGQTNLNKKLVLDISKYEKYFYAYPTIDFCTASYYIKKEYEEEFLKEFNNDFKNEMFIFKTEEFLENNIFGLENITKYSKDNLGDYISICKKGNYYLLTGEKGEFKGGHSGLSKDEMIIPLIVLNTNK